MSGCGRPVSRNTGEFEPYLKKFEGYFQQYNGVKMVLGNVTIKRQTLASSQLALCEISPEGSTILLNDTYWDILSDETKEVVFMHESGHCFVGRLHNNNRANDRQWESVMQQHPQLLRDYEEHKDEYLKELFSSNTSTPDEK